MRGGEAYLHIDDLQALIPTAKSKMVKLHAKFSSNVDLEWTDVDSTSVNFEVDYKLEHKSGHGIEAGSFKVCGRRVEVPCQVGNGSLRSPSTAHPVQPGRPGEHQQRGVRNHYGRHPERLEAGEGLQRQARQL